MRIATYTRLEEHHWTVEFGEFDIEEAEHLVDGVIQDYEENSIYQLDVMNWNGAIEKLMHLMIHKGFILSTNKDQDNNVVQRVIWKRKNGI